MKWQFYIFFNSKNQKTKTNGITNTKIKTADFMIDRKNNKNAL